MHAFINAQITYTYTYSYVCVFNFLFMSNMLDAIGTSHHFKLSNKDFTTCRKHNSGNFMTDMINK